jgi:hypothetical protein
MKKHKVHIRLAWMEFFSKYFGAVVDWISRCRAYRYTGFSVRLQSALLCWKDYTDLAATELQAPVIIITIIRKLGHSESTCMAPFWSLGIVDQQLESCGWSRSWSWALLVAEKNTHLCPSCWLLFYPSSCVLAPPAKEPFHNSCLSLTSTVLCPHTHPLPHLCSVSLLECSLTHASVKYKRETGPFISITEVGGLERCYQVLIC